ncbi:MAG: DEAD/DEAH box helicase [Nitrospinae bacterium]|nr:DEAD/DEAH box helicase [Nitrospinota bacterium]
MTHSSTAHAHAPALDRVQEGFETLGLIEPLCRAVRDENYVVPTPIQLQAIPHLLQGRDLIGCAQTGTGKTGAFALPILQRLAQERKAPGPKGASALILTPTRELAMQISDSFRVYGRHVKLSHAVVFGGVGYPQQIRTLSRGVDILVATPGRLLDLIEQRHARLDKVEVFVLDEADRMLDMGFLPSVRRIFSALPSGRQSMLFSATMPEEVAHLAKNFLVNPARVSVARQSTTAENIEQRVLFVDRENKSALLESVLRDESVERVIVFTRTKHGANKIVKNLSKSRIPAEAIHGNKSQSARVAALKKFRSGQSRILVATDIASRGLDVDGITHVINYELPNEAENYVHRIGRTARAGASGVAISFCDAEERAYLRNIEKTIARAVTVFEDHPFHSHAVASHGKRRDAPVPGNAGGRRTANRKSGAQPSGKSGASRDRWNRPAGETPKSNTGFRRWSRRPR